MRETVVITNNCPQQTALGHNTPVRTTDTDAMSAPPGWTMPGEKAKSEVMFPSVCVRRQCATRYYFD